MRNVWPALLVALLVPLSAALAGLTLNPSLRTEFSNCAAAGSASSTVTANVQYMARVSSDSDVSLCYAGTCAAGGELFPAGSMFTINFRSDQTTLSCRSAASTGDIIFTRAD